MNYLAHAYLSFNQNEILAGNMISDFVKGKKRYDYPAGIQAGITLHREIDRFTDDHPAIKNAKEIFRPSYRLYSAAIIDVVLDHFLATDENEFPGNALEIFADETYQNLSYYKDYFPEKFNMMFPYMKTQNWLYNYRLKWGIEKSLGGLVSRSKYMEESKTAFRLFNENYSELSDCYQSFFPEVKELAKNFLSTDPVANF
jgi:acyl carrier protein phosphodiesterase